MAPVLREPRDIYEGRAALVLKPGSTEEISAILKLAQETRTVRSLLDLKSQTPLVTIAASVIAGAASPDFRTLTIDKGWHIYANPVGLEDLASAQTVVTFPADSKPEVVKIDYPPGKVVKDELRARAVPR